MSTQELIVEALKAGQATLTELRKKVFDAAGYAASSQLEPALYALMWNGVAVADRGIYKMAAA
jgi:hypothetical protein